MFNIKKEEIRINVIPYIMLILSAIIGLTENANIRKVLVMFVVFLLGMQVQKTINIIKNRKEK
ncbi:MAG: hypothetical protein J6M60_00330 [Clostridia bacterium]|nr:hypothetical protein [Clostridia bacterium]